MLSGDSRSEGDALPEATAAECDRVLCHLIFPFPLSVDLYSYDVEAIKQQESESLE